MSLFTIVVLITSIGLCSSTTDYCDKSLCRSSQHIGCNPIKGFAPACGSQVAYIPMDSKLKQAILDKHNELRSKMAQGLDGFPQASRMPTLEWDDEMATIASFNARQCKIKHDRCRNTKQFRHSGQNLAMNTFGGKDKKPEKVVGSLIQKWFNEYRKCPKSVIQKFSTSQKGLKIGHFTQLVNDRVTKVGCSLIKYKTEDMDNLYFVCNYSMTNIKGQPVYAVGKTASDCETGPNRKFKGLCSINERV